MADPRAIVPYDDPYDNLSTDDLFNFINNRNPTLEDLSLFGGPTSLPSSSNPPQYDNIFGDANDPFDDPLFWDIGNEFTHGGITQVGCLENHAAGTSNQGGSTQAGPSENQVGTSDQGRAEMQTCADMKQFSVWPVPIVPYLCSCCMVLREIIHTNGNDTTKFEIHGRLGLICHAVLEIRQGTNPSQFLMIDFCKKSIEDVKEYLIQYCEERKQAGFIMYPDPLSVFYEAVCVGLSLDENTTMDNDPQPTCTNSGANEIYQPDMENDSERTQKTSLAAQRERTGKLSLRDLVNYFHLPIEEAARRMNLCPTVVKKICRRDGLLRWPHRKIKSIERRITMLSAKLRSNDEEERANAQTEIQKLRQELNALCAGVSRSV